MPPDGQIYTSHTQPTHEWGEKEYDGFVWAVIQNDVTYNCGCRNIHFKDIYLQKDRPIGLAIFFDKDNWSRSYYPNSKAPVQENITFENLVVEGDVKSVVLANTPVDNLRFVNCTLRNNTVRFVNIGTEGALYPKTNVLLNGTYFKENVDLLIDCKDGTSANTIIANTMDESLETYVSGNINIKSADIKINKA